LLPRLTTVSLTAGQSIARAGIPIDRVFFPRDSLISAVTRMRDGAGVEVTVCGREGFYGLQAALGDGASSTEAMVQIAGSAYGLRSADFLASLATDSGLEERVLRYAQAVIEGVSQFSSCNRLHPIDERCARWLLMAHDRVDGDEIFLTHEFVATMLGVRRPGVSLAVGSLERAGLIELHRARIVVRDRKGLEDACCECYEVANDAFERLLGFKLPKGSIHAAQSPPA
jgi:CRP-like cAMP-binding protein